MTIELGRTTRAHGAGPRGVDAERVPVVTPTPDFVGYLETPAIVAATGTDRWVTVTWADGLSARFHHVWLRDNSDCAECVLPLHFWPPPHVQVSLEVPLATKAERL